MSTKRQRDAAVRFMATIDACRGELHHEDATFELRNFDNWMVHCDGCDRELLEHSLDMMKRIVAAGPRGKAYKQVRTHFRDYAQAALDRRWPQDIPF